MIFLATSSNTSDSIQSTAHNSTTFIDNMSSQEATEFIFGLFQNKKHIFKRILEQQHDECLSKRSRNSDNEDRGPPTSTPIQSDGIVNKLQIDIFLFYMDR